MNDTTKDIPYTELQEYSSIKKLLVHHYETYHKECRVHIFVLNNQFHYNGLVTYIDNEKIEILDDKTKKYLSFPLDNVIVDSDMPYESMVLYIKGKMQGDGYE